MQSAVLLIEAADPTGSMIIAPVPSEHVMHLVNELQGQIFEFLFPGLLIEAEKVTDCEGIGP
jgi:hypothetical protein